MSVMAEESPAALRAVQLARGAGWCVTEYRCTAGPSDRPFEEQHQAVTIAGVVAGSFQYRCDAGGALLYPGAFLLGNADTCFECSHDHGVGDRCIAFHLTPGYFDEVAAGFAGRDGYRFSAAMLPARQKALPWLAWVQARAARSEALEMEEKVPLFVAAVIDTLAGGMSDALRPSVRDERRISTAIRHVEDHAGEALSLAELADIAAMSKYHFLRCFRHLVGMTPYQYLLDVRLRRAAVRLATSSEPVSAIAFDVGFSDLSTFNARFRNVFGISPTVYRRHERTS